MSPTQTEGRMSLTPQIDTAHTGRFDHLRCGTCGRPWDEHTADCTRHQFRPTEKAPEKETPKS